MRIGIITLWQSNDNYGQQLQCWALQQALLKLGHEPYLIRYDIDGRINNTKKPLWKKILKVVLLYPLIKKLIRIKKYNYEKGLILYNAIKNKERRFDEFRNVNIRQGDTLYKSLKELQDYPPQADAYIVGSDQVWAHLLSNSENRAMFLDFGDTKVKRIAYAPSFSMQDYPYHLKDSLKENLSRFDYLSVREETGLRICERLGFSAQVVLDPTMLLDSNDYYRLSTREEDGDYIYLYYLNIQNAEEVKWNELISFAKKHNLKIVATTASGYVQGREIFKGVEYQYATVGKWISLIKNAKLVVTTSFHGVVLSILHHTPFVYFPIMGKYSRGNNRVNDLCSMLGLSERIWNENMNYETIVSKKIDWNLIDSILVQERDKSFYYLQSALK